MQACVKIMRYIRWFLFQLSAILLAVSTVFATVNAIARFTAGGFTWAEELCAYCLVLMTYLAIPQLEGAGDQLCITAIDSVVKNPIAQRILNYVRGIITCGALGIVSYYGFQVMQNAFKRSQYTYVLQMPKGVLYGIAVVAMAAGVLTWIVIMVCNKGKFDRKESKETEEVSE